MRFLNFLRTVAVGVISFGLVVQPIKAVYEIMQKVDRKLCIVQKRLPDGQNVLEMILEALRVDAPYCNTEQEFRALYGPVMSELQSDDLLGLSDQTLDLISSEESIDIFNRGKVVFLDHECDAIAIVIRNAGVELTPDELEAFKKFMRWREFDFHELESVIGVKKYYELIKRFGVNFVYLFRNLVCGQIERVDGDISEVNMVAAFRRNNTANAIAVAGLRAQAADLRAQADSLRRRAAGPRAQADSLRGPRMHVNCLRWQAASPSAAEAASLNAQADDLETQAAGLRAQAAGLKAQTAGLRAQADRLKAQKLDRLGERRNRLSTFRTAIE
ncbi:MAG: hypothetical protein LBR79_05105 [Oscillospiraceae bacterium]|jgi:hypothetical protein|nr:hypothetical protein [Oscillospiraceae bacterium]